jgi:hypothetical protein
VIVDRNVFRALDWHCHHWDAQEDAAKVAMSEMEDLNPHLDGSARSQLAVNDQQGVVDALISSINADNLEGVEQALLRGQASTTWYPTTG